MWGRGGYNRGNVVRAKALYKLPRAPILAKLKGGNLELDLILAYIPKLVQYATFRTPPPPQRL
jgi:hypothetical protein